jgi:hypothetical protein
MVKGKRPKGQRNDIQYATQKFKDKATRTPLNTYEERYIL